MSLLILSATDVDAVSATLSPTDLLFLMGRVFIRLTSSQDQSKDEQRPSISIPPRMSIQTSNHTALFMPARMGPFRSSYPCDPVGETAVKVVFIPKRSGLVGLPATTLVLDELTGSVKAVVNARKLTALRNAAGSLLSTCLVGPSDPKRVVAFGAGQQIESHLDLHIRQFPSIKHCTIVNRSINERAVSLQGRLNTKHPQVAINILSSIFSPKDHEQDDHERIEHAVQSANIIICATSSTIPLFSSQWVKTGAHIILIGSYTPSMREVDKSLIFRALSDNRFRDARAQGLIKPFLLVDSREACLHEAGELLDARIQHQQMTEIGELVAMDEGGHISIKSHQGSEAQKKRGDERGFDGPVTIFKSVGIGLQDVAIATAIIDKALAVGSIGTVIADYDVL